MEKETRPDEIRRGGSKSSLTQGGGIRDSWLPAQIVAGEPQRNQVDDNLMPHRHGPVCEISGASNLNLRAPRFLDIPYGISNPESGSPTRLSAIQHAASAPRVAAVTGTIREEERDE
jgi:hypothetical protein